MSAESNALNAQIEWQDTLLALALVDNASPKFLERIRAVRDDLVKQWGVQIQRDQFEAHDQVPA